MVLMDKGYYDYDYKPLSEVQESVIKSYKPNEVKIRDYDQDKLERRMAAFGMGKYAEPKEDLTSLTDAEFQAHAIKDIENNGRR